jgi:hypothetical protein
MIIELGKVTEETKSTSPIAPLNDEAVYSYPL